MYYLNNEFLMNILSNKNSISCPIKHTVIQLNLQCTLLVIGLLCAKSVTDNFNPIQTEGLFWKSPLLARVHLRAQSFIPGYLPTVLGQVQTITDLFQTNSNTSFVLEAQFVGVFLRAHIFIQGYFSTLILQVQLITDHFKAIHAEDLF